MAFPKKELARVLYYLIGIIILVFFLFPPFWGVLVSLKKFRDIISLEWPSVFMFTPTLESYKFVLREWNFFQNSLVIAGISTPLTVAVGSLAAYGFARFKFRGRDDLMFYILTTRIFPPIVTVIPYFAFASEFGLLDTYPPLIVLYTFMNLALVIWLMRGIYEEIPPEYEESAMVDGCSRLEAFRRVVLPLAAPGLLVSALFSFLFSWNEYLFALALSSSRVPTTPVLIHGYMPRHRLPWNELMAVGNLHIIPTLMLVLVLRKYLVRGLTFGLIKK